MMVSISAGVGSAFTTAPKEAGVIVVAAASKDIDRKTLRRLITTFYCDEFRWAEVARWRDGMPYKGTDRIVDVAGKALAPQRASLFVYSYLSLSPNFTVESDPNFL